MGITSNNNNIITTNKNQNNSNDNDNSLLTMRIYRRILEKSCETNQAFDDLFLKNGEDEDDDDSFDQIGKQLEIDVLALLRPKESAKFLKEKEKAQLKFDKLRQKKEQKL